jgi:trans-aconitate 2-methyltransferase
MQWDPDQYSLYANERARPFMDLLARLGTNAPRRVVDLGCGPGNLTALLADKWPDAIIDGIDSSAEMIARARGLGDDRLHFELGDIASWTPGGDVDVVVSNAALQWVPEHERLLRAWTNALPSGAWLAWQVPGNFESPSHALMYELAYSPQWSDRLAGVVQRRPSVLTPAEYTGLLLNAGWQADVWETTYLHVLQGTDPVLDWLRGTGLRPILGALNKVDRVEFETEFAALLRTAYPAEAYGTVLPFRRIFAIGYKA